MRTWILETDAELRGLRQDLRQEINTRAGAHADRILGDVAHDLVIVASELATNAIHHGRPPTIVELFQREHRFLLTAADHDRGSEPRIAGDRPPGEGGFGLQMPAVWPATSRGTAPPR
ncbi:ATP-binding protein [Cellulomonas phragmiteti]|uniref:Histidine kinase/HSP90-like ATPase domain-containing protein n=1 Tax=Cellulomonas phragmiteti TaxID=478780 RepID=A0ABQ4DMM8_9CELL|nr:ATP-binding protein [Cellulomonas phragmiteti]GIG40598.1 hypothetical protein Cph01nite_23600 [Cellulomonas phragmiteti]